MPPPQPTPTKLVLACAAATGWFWGLTLLAARGHEILEYYVLASAPPVTGFLALPVWQLGAFLGLSSVLAMLCLHDRQGASLAWSKPVRWLLLAYTIPLLDVLRVAGLAIPYTFGEPLLLTWITGAAVASLAAHQWELPLRASRLPAATPQAITGLLTVAAAGWWYYQGCTALDEFFLGYHDFGHFAFRVASTWQGRGFLLETPSLPAFWDHFNPGLALLTPLWGLWPDARLFILLQAICLAAPAPVVFRIARLWGMTAANAAVWAAVYLAFPAVGQLNLNYSYGWHPISLALPWLFATVAALLARRYAWAAGFAILAGSFEEAVIVALACLAAALGLQAWWVGRRPALRDTEPDSDAALAQRLPAVAWLATWAVLAIAFVLIARYAAFTRYQTGRFENLGQSGLAIALSPLLRPRAFWGEALQPKSLLFLAACLLPWTLTALYKGRLLLLAAAFPLGLLLGWKHPPAKSIAFQYMTTLLPILLLAAMAGARRVTCERNAASPGSPVVPGDHSLGWAALASCLVASTLFGALPWSSPTMTILLAQSYQVSAESPTVQNPRAPGTAGHRALTEIVARINTEQSSVLASGRIAAHLLNVRRLETVEQALVRWDALSAEAGAGRFATEVFDWIVLDTWECFQQSLSKMETILADARRAGYQPAWSGEGIIVLARPQNEIPLARPTETQQ